MDNEEEYINVGRRLLAVNKYAVNSASTMEALHEVECSCLITSVDLFTFYFLQVFWKEVAAVVDGSDGNTLIVLPELMTSQPSSFYQLVDEQLVPPLTEWASGDKQVSSCLCASSSRGDLSLTCVKFHARIIQTSMSANKVTCET